jgi:hypothetical protein
LSPPSINCGQQQPAKAGKPLISSSSQQRQQSMASSASLEQSSGGGQQPFPAEPLDQKPAFLLDQKLQPPPLFLDQKGGTSVFNNDVAGQTAFLLNRSAAKI